MYTFSSAFVSRTIERSEWADVQWPAGQLACFVHREKRHMHEQYPNYVALIPNVIAVYFNYSIRLIMPAIATKAMHILNTKQFLPEQTIGQYFEPVVRSFIRCELVKCIFITATQQSTARTHRCGFPFLCGFYSRIIRFKIFACKIYTSHLIAIALNCFSVHNE